MSAEISSAFANRIATALAAGQSMVLAAASGELGLLEGEALPIHDLVGRVGASLYPLVVRLNAVDPPQVVHGADVAEQACVAAGLPVVYLTQDDAAMEPGDRRSRIAAVNEPVAAPVDPAAAVRALLTQDQVGVLVLVEQADILLQDPAVHDVADRNRVACLQLAMRDAFDHGQFRNAVVLFTGEMGQIPQVLRAGSEVAAIGVSLPSRVERRAFIARELADDPACSSYGTDELDDRAAHLAALTDGERLRTVASILRFSRASGLGVSDPVRLVDCFRHGPRQDYWGHLRGRLPLVREFLRARVFGQDQAIDRVVEALAAASIGLRLDGGRGGREGQPRGVLTFQGPTGTGKTELAKALAEVLFGDPEAYVRFDMSTILEAHEAIRLFGAPPSYVGHEQGGELTNAVIERPAIVILLDEIEKAHPAVFDRLLSIIDDGRVTDGQGRTVYFSDAFIIATTNAGAAELADLVRQHGDSVVVDNVERIGASALRAKFDDLNRPEFYGRLAPGIVGFDILRPEVVAQITERLIADLVTSEGPSLVFDVASTTAHLQHLLADPAASAYGGRMVRNEFMTLVRKVSKWIVLDGHHDAKRAEIFFLEGVMYGSIDGSSEVEIR